MNTAAPSVTLCCSKSWVWISLFQTTVFTVMHPHCNNTVVPLRWMRSPQFMIQSFQSEHGLTENSKAGCQHHVNTSVLSSSSQEDKLSSPGWGASELDRNSFPVGSMRSTQEENCNIFIFDFIPHPSGQWTRRLIAKLEWKKTECRSYIGPIVFQCYSVLWLSRCFRGFVWHELETLI